MTKPFGLVRCLACFLLCCAPDYSQTGRPVPPGVREADKQTNAPVEPPVKWKQKPIDTAAVKQEAEELAKLSAAIPSRVDQVAQGQLPKDLAEQLKRIEKLAKHLRSQVSP